MDGATIAWIVVGIVLLAVVIALRPTPGVQQSEPSDVAPVEA